MMKFLMKYYVRKELLNLKGSKLGQILHADKQTWSHIVCRKILEGQILA